MNPGNSGGPLLDARTGEVLGLVDLGSSEVNGIAFAVSSRVAKPLLEAWQAAPQPIAAAECEPFIEDPEPIANPPAPPSAPGLVDFVGGYFRIPYPDYWNIEAAEIDKGGYLDTTIRNPDDPFAYLRVDVSPSSPTGDPETNAAPVVDAVSRQAGYLLLDYSLVNYNGYDALWWEFLVTEKGVLLHKVDVFFIDDYGAGFAVLLQAPEAVYYEWLPIFDEIRSLFVVNYN